MYGHEEVGCLKAMSSIPVRLYYTYDDNIPHARSLMAILNQRVSQHLNGAGFRLDN